MACLMDSIRGHRSVLEKLHEAHQKDRLASTLLFTGPSGIGKKLSAIALAQTLVCERLGEVHEGPFRACGECGACLRVERRQSESLLVIEPSGGGGIKIEQVRDILQFIVLQKLGRARVVIIDQAHTLNPQSANALLKSLEEPPAGTYFILISSVGASVLPTIRSRAQVVRFRALLADELAEVLGIPQDDWLIEAAQGSLETAARLLEDRAEFVELDAAALEFATAALQRFPADETARLRELTKERTAQAFVANLLQSAIKNALRVKAGVPLPRSGAESFQNWADFSLRVAQLLPPPALDDLAEASLVLEQDMGRNVERGLLLENFALQLRPSSELAIDRAIRYDES